MQIQPAPTSKRAVIIFLSKMTPNVLQIINQDRTCHKIYIFRYFGIVLKNVLKKFG